MAEYMTLERLKELSFVIEKRTSIAIKWENPVYPLLADGTFGEVEAPVQDRFYTEDRGYFERSGSTSIYCYKSTTGENYGGFDRVFYRNAANGTIEARPEWFDQTKVRVFQSGTNKVEYAKYSEKQDCIFLGDGGICDLQFGEYSVPNFNRLYMKFDSALKRYTKIVFFENKPYGTYSYTKWTLDNATERELLAAYNPPPRFPAIFVGTKRIGGLWVKQGQQLVKPSAVYVRQNGVIKKV
ncbi:hypothetical protein [Murdochiella massiliensis]|uniref:hypothetical protein n=1 Tax=Murdochiella massiliensis TaxID=1673723 RepID=UPI00083743F3|nr:hypothetical protein [Murdochiella massiliensis]